MTTAQRVGLALIAKNEAATLPTLLASITGAFDRVVLVDTGSEDGTVQAFTAWCESPEGPPSWATATMAWEDDFAAARNAADELLLNRDEHGMPAVDWTCWADCDDELRGARNLRALAAQAAPELAAFVADYEYAHDQHGNCICILRRERLVRAAHAGRWAGDVHEAQIIKAPLAPLDPTVATWIHRKPLTGLDSNERNLRILRAWNEREPDQPRVLVYLGTELLTRSQYAEAIPFLERYLQLPGEWLEERAQVHRKLAICHLQLGDMPAAQEVALRCITLLPDWPDTYLTLAHVAYHQANWPNAASFARRVLDLGQPQSLLILNPMDYTFQPRLILAGSLGEQGRIQEALDIGEQATRLVPDHPGLQLGMRTWQQHLKRTHTADSALAMAQLLVQHDEQAKALAFLEQCVPYYVHDDPRVVQARHQIRARTQGLVTHVGQADHYREATERGIPEEDMRIVPHLSRAQFLLNGLREQIQAAA